MSGKTWHVARYEYGRRVLRPSFLFILLSLPLAVALFAAIVVLAERLSASDLPMGYVDRADVLPVQAPLPATVAAGGRSPGESNAGQLVPLVAYGTEHAARAALDAGEVQAYFVIADDYRQTDRVALVYADPPSDEAVRQFRDFLQRSLLHDLPPAVAARAVTGSHLMVETPDGARTLSPERLLDTLLPFFAGMAIMMLFFLNANYFAGIVAEEKASRTVEVLVTSTSPGSIVAGKVAGLLGVVLTEVAGWTALLALVVIAGGRYAGIDMLQGLRPDAEPLVAVTAVGVPVFVMLAALVAALGAGVEKPDEVQRLTILFALPLMAPLWVMGPLLENPHSALAIILTLAPPTALPTLAARLAFSLVPPWQTWAAAGLATLAAAGALWLAGRAFRLGLLRYGRPLQLREMLGMERP